MGWQDAPLLEETPATSGWRSAPVDDRHPFVPVTSDDGKDEDIYFHSTGQIVKAPPGTGELLTQISNDDTFDAPIGPSTTLEETAAMYEKQAAYLALLAVSFDMVDKESAAYFISDRSKALASAQSRQPLYMKKFNEDLEKANGIFGVIGVVLSHPRAFGRSIITQSPNSALPLLAGAAGAKGGAVAGSTLATVAGQAGPQVATPEEIVTVPAGAIIGGYVGSRMASAPANAAVEAGATLDQLLSERGVDITNTEQVMYAFENKDLMDDLRTTAIKKGVTVASIDMIFDIAGGTFLKGLKRSTRLQKVTASAGDVAVQTVGEGVSEAGGSYAAFGEVDIKDATFEAMTSLGQSVGQTAIDTVIPSGKKQTDKDTTPTAEPTAPKPEVVEQVQQAEIAAIEDTQIENVAQAESTKIVKQFMAGQEIDLTSYDEAQQKAIQSVLDEAAPVRERVIKGRVNKLDNDIEIKLSEIDQAETDLATAKADGRGTKRLTARVEKLFNEWETLDRERGELLTIENPLSESADTLAKDVTVKGRTIDRVTKDTIANTQKAFRAARNATKKDIKSLQKTVVKAIRESGLNKQDQASFLNTVTSIQSVEQLQTQIPKIQARIENKINKAYRKELVGKIKNISKKSRKSGVIAIDFAKQIQDLVSEIDTNKRSEKTIADLQATLDYMKNNPDASMPKDVLAKLELLNKTRIEDVKTAELESILADMERLVAQGKAKLKLLEIQKQRRQKKRLEELSEDATPLDTRPLKKASLGERLSIIDTVKNKYLQAANKMQRLGLYKNPMDVIFDIQDGGKDYKGASIRIFKQTIDAAHNRYLNLKESATRDIKNLADKLKLDSTNYERIGVYAAAQQEGGVEKLKASGYTQAEIDSLYEGSTAMTEAEMEMYNLMREKLDGMRAGLAKVMRLVYNKDFVEVKDYFPFLTDFEAMKNYEIADMFGDDAPLMKLKQKNVNRSFTIERKGGKQAIRVDAMNVFLNHVDNAAYLIEMGQDIKELSELASSDSYGDIAGDLGQEIASDWLNLLAKKGRIQESIRAADVLRKNTGFATLAFKLSSALIQPTALMDGSAIVGGTYVSDGVSKVATSKEWRAFLKDNVPEIRDRVGDDPAYMEMGGDGVVGKVQEAGMWALKNLDLLSASSVAIGAYIKSVEQRGGVVDLKNPDPIAIQEAQLAVRRTQSSSFAKDAAPVISQGKLTGNVSIDKLLLQFQSFMLNRWSIIEHDFYRTGVKKGKIAKSLNIATWLILANAAEMSVRHMTDNILAAMFGYEPPEDEEELPVKVVKQALYNVPVVSQVSSVMDYGAVPVPSISLLSKTFSELKYMAQSDDPDTKAKHAAQAAILAIGQTYGIPGTVQASTIARKAMADDSSGW